MARVDVMGCTWTQDFSFSSATIHAAFATATRDSQHEHEYHERFDFTVLRIFGARTQRRQKNSDFVRSFSGFDV